MAVAIILAFTGVATATAQVSYVDTIIPEPDPYAAGIEYPQQPSTDEILERLKAAEEKIAELTKATGEGKEEKADEKKEEKKKKRKRAGLKNTNSVAICSFASTRRCKKNQVER